MPEVSDGLLTISEQVVPFKARAVATLAQALMKVPQVNINLVRNSIHQFNHATVSVAIATDEGLYPATLYKTDTLSPWEIAQATAALAEKAKGGNLTWEDICGGTFAVSFYG